MFRNVTWRSSTCEKLLQQWLGTGRPAALGLIQEEPRHTQDFKPKTTTLTLWKLSLPRICCIATVLATMRKICSEVALSAISSTIYLSFFRQKIFLAVLLHLLHHHNLILCFALVLPDFQELSKFFLSQERSYH